MTGETPSEPGTDATAPAKTLSGFALLAFFLTVIWVLAIVLDSNDLELTLVLAVPSAVVCAHIAWWRIWRSEGRLIGWLFVWIALLPGYPMLAFIVALIIALADDGFTLF